MKWILYFDGSCEPRNPGGVSTAGWVLKQDGVTVRSESLYVSEGSGSTNNQAEYAALIAGLKVALPLIPAIDHILIRGDSNLIINQITLAWKCNKDHLRLLRDEARTLLAGRTWEAEWIPREQNSDADELSQRAYVVHTGNPYPARREWK